jgi:hypothetical protein
MEVLVNKVSESGIITLDLEKFLPQEEILLFDLKDFLFMGMILKEKDYRTALKEKDWNEYKDKIVAVHCSADAIIPYWAYMLCTTFLQPVVKQLHFGSKADVRTKLLLNHIEAIDANLYSDVRVVIKGCGDAPIPESAYLSITNKLLPVAKSIMYGEPCSTVPVFKRK